MAHAHGITLDSTETRNISAIRGKLFSISLIVGIVGLILMAVSAFTGSSGHGHGENDPWTRRLILGYMVGLSYFISISLGAMVFVLLQHLSRAGWSVTVRRIAEIMAANIKLLAILFIPVLVVVWCFPGTIYHWNGHVEADDIVLTGKLIYLNKGFFTLRVVFYFVFASCVSSWYLRTSRMQDEQGGTALTLDMQSRSAPLVFFSALVITFFAFDVIMGLDAHWFSTMFGVYFFAGGFLNFFAMSLMIVFFLQQRSILTKAVTIENVHDLAKFMFAFVFFWGYVGFSQYMLIWYANLPEETLWFAHRGATEMAEYAVGTPGWGYILLSLLFLHFLIPFPCLFSRWTKRIGKLRMFFVTLLMFMHYVDLTWLIMPEVKENNICASLFTAFFATIGVGGLWVAGLVKTAGDQTIVPENDPRVCEALNYENY